MRISSRTPEGEPNRCPICHSNIVIEPSQPFGDARCPCCGRLLWFETEPKPTEQQRSVESVEKYLKRPLGRFARMFHELAELVAGKGG